MDLAEVLGTSGTSSSDDDLPIGVLRHRLQNKQLVPAATATLVGAWARSTARARPPPYGGGRKRRSSFKAPRMAATSTGAVDSSARPHEPPPQPQSQPQTLSQRCTFAKPSLQVRRRRQSGGASAAASSAAFRDPASCIVFPSRARHSLPADALADVALTRDLPSTFADVRSMCGLLRAACIGEIQHAVTAVAKRFWRASASSRGLGTAIPQCRRSGVNLYAHCSLVTFVPPGREQRAAPARYYLKIQRTELERSSRYGLGDLWLLWIGASGEGVGIDRRFHAKPVLFWSKWHGPSSARATIEMQSLGVPPPRPSRQRRGRGGRGKGGKTNSPFDDGAPCVGLRVGNIASLLAQLYTLDAIERPHPILIAGMRPNAGAGNSTAMTATLYPILCGGHKSISVRPLAASPTLLDSSSSSSTVDDAVWECARRVANTFTLNIDQAAVLKSVAQWLAARPLPAIALLDGSNEEEEEEEDVADAMLRADVDAVLQDRSVARAENGVCVVHGVFGSGKSHLLEAVLTFLAESLAPSEKVLFAATTNAAVDRVMGGLLDRGIAGLDLVRCGSVRRIAPRLLPKAVPCGELDLEMKASAKKKKKKTKTTKRRKKKQKKKKRIQLKRKRKPHDDEEDESDETEVSSESSSEEEEVDSDDDDDDDDDDGGRAAKSFIDGLTDMLKADFLSSRDRAYVEQALAGAKTNVTSAGRKELLKNARVVGATVRLSPCTHRARFFCRYF